MHIPHTDIECVESIAVACDNHDDNARHNKKKMLDSAAYRFQCLLRQSVGTYLSHIYSSVANYQQCAAFNLKQIFNLCAFYCFRTQ